MLLFRRRRPPPGEFERLIRSELAGEISGLQALQRRVQEWVLALLIIFAAFFWFGFEHLPSPVFRGWLEPFAVGYGALAVFLISRKAKVYQREFKQRVMVPLCGKFFPELKYQSDQFVDRQHYSAAQLFRQELSTYTGNDRFVGKLGEVDFEFSELLCRYTTGSGKNRRTHTAFRGFFFVGDFHRKLSFRTQIVPDHAEGAFGVLGRGLQRLFSSRSDQLVDLENVTFEKLFKVTSGDQLEARLILTPRLMEKLVDFRRLVGNSVRLSFQGDRMYLAVSTHHDYFEPRWWGEVVDRRELLKFIDMLVLMLAVADEILQPHSPVHSAGLGPLPSLATQGFAPVRKPVIKPAVKPMKP